MAMDLTYLLPTFNAYFNFLSACALLMALRFVRQKRIEAHRNAIICALCFTVLFLAGYLTYHRVHGITRYEGTGGLRVIYFIILATHTILAVSLVPLITVTFRLAWTQKISAHRRLARWTFPIWLYVSVTGVIIYIMLYHIPAG